MSARIYAASLSALLFAACAGGSPPRVLATPVPGKLVPIGETLVGTVTARGVQIYECRARGDSTGAEWAFVAPEADLYDEQGRPAGKHYAGPSWDAGRRQQDRRDRAGQCRRAARRFDPVTAEHLFGRWRGPLCSRDERAADQDRGWYRA
jgi:hypothetical protein